MPKLNINTALLAFLFIPFQTIVTKAQEPFKGLESLFTAPHQYTAAFTAAKPAIDGNIDEPVWANVPWTTNFTDIEGIKKPAPFFTTRCKMVWDSTYLYIAAELKDDHVWANVTKHDEVVFQDNDFEVFIDPNHQAQQYFEIEVNGLNTVWELFLPKAYRNGSGSLISWDAPGLRTAVKVQGTVNHTSDKDHGWTVEMAIPYSALSIGDHVKIPERGDLWRINFSRVQWDTHVVNGRYVKDQDAAGKNLPERNWVWSPQGIINMHYPERWGYLKFGGAAEENSMFELPYAERAKNYLWLVYYKQQEYRNKFGKYARSLKKLSVPATIVLDGKRNQLQMEATDHQFYITLKADGQQTVTLNQNGLIQTLKSESENSYL